MTIRLKPTKKEQLENNIDNFEQRIGKALKYLNAGEISEEQFINEIRVAHVNYKHTQRKIYNSEE